ncbi:polysaccharide biosynthesis protein [Bacillus sp. AFS053548]|uniref:putative polysaccharide biosynthesis protein n=1 Tax=Bacillus sp. AFS053548 TaxID=2033505 RepID=UPI000BFD0A51|nr:polysaccharide biosynthesis protein [Bacillus sp. AFS053548]PGM55700.1 cell division protein [Bacillus sp. AFS053548]
MSDSKLLRGTFILTAGTFLIKFLGMIYTFPFYALVGSKGSALYNYGYVPYTLFISIATAGVPLAVAKFVSKYNAIEEYETSRRLFHASQLLLICTGIFSFLTLYIIAPYIAPLMIPKDTKGNSVEDVVSVMRIVSTALILVPSQSLYRGFFQGHQSTGPTTVSQLIEQIVRIVFTLVGSYIILKVMGGTITQAVGLSTFAATIGAVGGILNLLWYWRKRKVHLDELLPKSKGLIYPTKLEMFKELFSYSIPYVFVGLAIPLYQLVDQFTYNRAMEAIGLKDMAENTYVMFSYTSHKLVMIPVSLATAFGLTLVPAITEAFVNKNHKKLQSQITQTYQVVFFLTLPAVVGISVLAEPIYSAFYQKSTLGGSILGFYAPVALLYSLFTVNVAILQGLDKQKYAIIGLIGGVILKIVLNVPLIHLFKTYGAVSATALGYLFSIVYNFYYIRKNAQFSFNKVFRRIIFMIILSGLMAGAVYAVEYLLGFWWTYKDGRMISMLLVIIGAIVGAIVYLGVAYKLNLFEIILGARLKNRFKFGKRG